MIPFQQTKRYQLAFSHYTSLEKTLKLNESELPILETIISNPNFDQISITFSQIEQYEGKLLQKADRQQIALKLMNISANKSSDEQLQSKLAEGIERLQEIISDLQQYALLINEKFNWLQKQVSRYQQSTDDIQQEIDIIRSQNSKGNTIDTKENDIDSGQLKQLLKHYHCQDRPFPKNKTETLMLINRLEAIIQQHQIRKLDSFHLEQ